MLIDLNINVNIVFFKAICMAKQLVWHLYCLHAISFNWTNNFKTFVVDVIITTYVLKRYAIVFSTKQYM